MSNLVSPEIILNELLERATSRTARALNILYQVLEKQSKSDKMDFSIVTVGQLSFKAGGPSTQTIRNRTGKHFQQLIEAWATYAGTTTKKPLSIRQKQLIKGNDRQVLESITDPVLRAVVGSLIAERNRYRDQLNTLKANTDIIIDKTKTEIENKVAFGLSPMEFEALEAAISDDFMTTMNWTVKPTGQVKDVDGNEVYKRGYVNVIRKVVAE